MNLTRGEVRRLAKELKPHKLPKVGWCKMLGRKNGRRGELCHEAKGYYLVEPDGPTGFLDGARRRRKRR